MFLGTIDDNVRRYIAGNRAAFGGQEIVVGCSGNFTSEKVLLQEAQPLAVHSNDVSLYSLLLADAMLGQSSPLTIREPEYEWLGEHLFGPSPWARPAAVMLLLRLLKFEKRKTVYARRMWTHYREKFADLVSESATGLAARAIPITSYYSGDVLEHFQRHGEKDAIFTAYLPFFKGDYEHQYKRLQQIIGWPEPSYPMLDGDRKEKIIRWMTEGGRRYLFLLNYPLEGGQPQMVSHKQRNTWVYLYANVVQRLGLFRRKYGDTGRRFKLVEPSFRFGPNTRVEVVPVSSADIQHYKSLYLARNIDFTAAEQGFACLADNGDGGGVFGFIEMSRGKGTTGFTFEGKHYNGAQFWYMLSDFPVEPKPHDKVSKLIVMLALTREMRRRLERTNLIRTCGVLTTARTEKPVSMKYRGPMKLLKRGEKDGEKFLNYIALWPAGERAATEQEVYREWWKRFGKN